MTEFDTSGLQALRDNAPAPTGWQPLQLDTLHPGTYLAADQSLTEFGFVLFEVSPERRCAVHLANTFKVPEGDDTGPDALLRRVGELEDQLTRYVDQWVLRSDWGLVAAVHEMPPIMRGKMAKLASRTRPEISFLTALAFRNATRELPLLPSISRSNHARLLCGENPKDKKPYHDQLKKLFPQIRGADELVTNGGTRDALSIAIYAAHRGF